MASAARLTLPGTAPPLSGPPSSATVTHLRTSSLEQHLLAPLTMPPPRAYCLKVRKEIPDPHVIEHLREPLPAFEELFRALRPGGLLIAETLDYLTAHQRGERNPWDDYSHARPVTFRSLERLAVDAGLRIRHAGRKPHFGYWTKHLLKRGWTRQPSALPWHLRLGMVRDDLLFVLERPA
jgi:hypothetical protein